MFDDVVNFATCPIPVRAYQIPTTLLLVLRDYFTSKHRKYIPGCQKYVFFGPDGTRNKSELVRAIEIERIGDRKTEHTDLPKILIKRNAAADTTQGINNGQRMAPRASSVFETQTSSSTTFFAMSQISDEADLIGFEVFELMRHIAPYFRTQLQLTKFKANQIGDLGTLRAFPGFFAVPITVDYLYRDNVKISNDAFPVRELKLQITTRT